MMLNQVQNYKEIPKSQNLLCQNIPKSQNLLCQNIPESHNLLYLALRINTFRKGWWKLRNRWKHLITKKVAPCHDVNHGLSCKRHTSRL